MSVAVLEPGTRVRDTLIERARIQDLIQREKGKTQFTKVQSYYVKKTIPIIPYKCQNCVWFTPENACILVTSKGKPSEGQIRPEGTCALWNANELRIKYAELYYGRGEGKEGISPGVIRSRVEKLKWTIDDPQDVP